MCCVCALASCITAHQPTPQPRFDARPSPAPASATPSSELPAPAARRPVVGEASIGVQAIHGGERWVAGGTLGAAGEAGIDDAAFLRVAGRFNYDFSAEEIDSDRHPSWAEGRLMLGALPIEPSHSFRLGARAELSFVENTPTSIERDVRALGGPALILQSGGTRLDIVAGGYSSIVELDDDLPRLRGFDRDELESDHHGPMAAGTFTQTLGSGWLVAATARVLFGEEFQVDETTVGAAIEVPLATESCLRLSAEERFFDPQVRSGLPYIRDGFVRLELVLFFGGRSPRSYGF
jgi:hypothetical protein